jgi:hypothetical protein
MVSFSPTARRQKAANKTKSSVRVRVERVYGGGSGEANGLSVAFSWHERTNVSEWPIWCTTWTASPSRSGGPDESGQMLGNRGRKDSGVVRESPESGRLGSFLWRLKCECHEF